MVYPGCFGLGLSSSRTTARRQEQAPADGPRGPPGVRRGLPHDGGEAGPAGLRQLRQPLAVGGEVRGDRVGAVEAQRVIVALALATGGRAAGLQAVAVERLV